MSELLDKQEPLNPDLVPYVVQTEHFGFTVLKHPLVFAVPYHDFFNHLYNEQYRMKKEALEKALKEKRWATWVFLHERPHRFDAFVEMDQEHHEEISNTDFWEIFGACWTDTENMWQMEDNVRYLFEWGMAEREEGRSAMMDKEEHALLDSMPEEFVVYRGHSEENQMGLSWTLSRWKARWFAQRFAYGKKICVSRAVCRKEHVIGLFLGRKEFEIGVLPECLTDIQKVKKLHRPPTLKRLFQFATGEFKLGPNSYHGPQHWEDVETNAIALAKATPGADMTVCRLFAILHDTQRQDEDEDKLHGTRAARFIKRLYEEKELPVSSEQLKMLLKAVVNHTAGETTDDPTIGVCWDADRMDLVRVGDIPDRKFFSTKAGKELLWRV